jgi:Uma2 family endonuclease
MAIRRVEVRGGSMVSPKLERAEVYYPESDGQPMAETDVHRNLMVDLIAAVDWHFRDDPEFYVSGNLFLYYEEGAPEKVIAPDFFVVRGVPRGERRTFKLWKEGKGPALVIELTSKSTATEDRGNKRVVYEEIGVQEYFIFDPEGSQRRPSIAAFRRSGEYFLPADPLRVEGGVEVFSIRVLGLELHASQGTLRFVDPRTARPLPIPTEAYRAAESERERAESERERAESERERAESERERANRAEAELVKLREEIARARGNAAP